MPTEKQEDKIKRVYKTVRQDRMRKILSCFFMALLLVSLGGILYKTVFLKTVHEQDTAQQRRLYHEEDAEPDSGSIPELPGETSSRFGPLYQQNPDICGWITMLNTKIDYPVYTPPADDPGYYLTHDARKRKSSYGAIYLDHRIQFASQPRTLILYGHNMNDGSMFHDLTQYKSLSFYKENPVFSFNTLTEEASWKIFSVFVINTRSAQGAVFDYQRTDFVDDEDFLAFSNQLRDRSLIQTGIDLCADDQLLLLSTCSYEHPDFRTVVVARKVRTEESPVVDTEDATLAANPIRPDVCAKCRHGGA